MTNRDGEIVQHYTYKAFGYEEYYISTSEAFRVTM